MKLAALVALLVLVACGREAPRYYSIDDAFDAAQRATIESAVDAWCAETGDCPELALFAEARFELARGLHELGEVRMCESGHECATFATESDRVIRIAPEVFAKGLDVLWTVAAHEWGHICIDGHPVDDGVMASYEPNSLTIGAKAARAWREGCH